jgi:hypothetical protein
MSNPLPPVPELVGADTPRPGEACACGAEPQTVLLFGVHPPAPGEGARRMPVCEEHTVAAARRV